MRNLRLKKTDGLWEVKWSGWLTAYEDLYACVKFAERMNKLQGDSNVH